VLGLVQLELVTALTSAGDSTARLVTASYSTFLLKCTARLVRLIDMSNARSRVSWARKRKQLILPSPALIALLQGFQFVTNYLLFAAKSSFQPLISLISLTNLMNVVNLISLIFLITLITSV
jgi:hypothetical protein